MSSRVEHILIPTAVIALVLILYQIGRRALQSGKQLQLRPLQALRTLSEKIGQGSESGTSLHVSLGRAGLASAASPTSIAAAKIYYQVALDGCANGTPPVVTVGEGSLLLLAQEELSQAHVAARRDQEFEPDQAQFLASEADPYAYAGGVSELMQQREFAANVLVGRFGAEVALMTDTSRRQNIMPIIGSDDPVALAVSVSDTDDLLIGEELFAAGAYLEGDADQLAMLRVQDILRVIAAIAVAGLAIYRLALNS